MKSLRLEAVASLVKENCNVLDVGTDHAYLPIILSKTGKCQSIIASDVSNNALSYGEANLKKYHITNVKLVLSDGLKNIRDKYDTLTNSYTQLTNIPYEFYNGSAVAIGMNLNNVYYAAADYTKSTGNIEVYAKGWTLVGCVVTVQYTKTTDTSTT